MEGLRDEDKLKPTFLGDYLPSKGPKGQSADGLTDDELRALPFIGMFVGVDELIPTKAVYAVCDPSNCGITYVRGDGTFAIARQICFTRHFKDTSIPNYRSQRTYLPELIIRTAMYHHHTYNKEEHLANGTSTFTTISSVKASLTYLGDLEMESCPALTAFDSTPIGPDLATHHLALKGTLKWNFSTAGFQAFAPQGIDIVTTKHQEFKQKYINVNISLDDFQQALFCLGGMLKAGLIDFLREGQNDRRYFVPGLTRVKPSQFVTPRRTSIGWTVDCFVARFSKFHDVYCADSRLKKLQMPWEISVKDRDNSIISWELLKTLQLKTQGDTKTYPKSLVPKGPQPLILNDIIDKRGKFRESKNARKQREAQEKVNERPAKEDLTIDLTQGDGFMSGHMINNPRPIHDANQHFVISNSKSRARTSAADSKRKNIGGRGLSNENSNLDDDNNQDDDKPAHVAKNKKDEHNDKESGDSVLGRHRRKKSRRAKSPSPLFIDDLAKHLED
ncbi:uncharacterized protein RCO7_09420 [Rhynchosporium graminicola]|uniref:Uncharacterized protein n=1 Tax=Rhynchosporium graminicola TaxID=2792576 RepID=A0A1E1KWK4_9HELO|nr:uncharacterized protein RCO7_09420 [Rhynchosporium commune]